MATAIKRESYADFLRSISASYAKAKAGKGDPEEANLLRATTVIELIADRKIAAEADRDRRDLIRLFKDDLDIPLDEEDDDHAAGQTGADVLA